MYDGFWNISFWFWITFISYFNEFYFYWIHRMMHPWFIEIKYNNDRNKVNVVYNSKYRQFDFGYYLFKHVHSLHHRSSNTGPWSGLSMHPIEHIIYFGSMYLPIVLMFYFNYQQHYLHFLFSKYHTTLNPIPAHDGYDTPGGGSYFHYIHHRYIHCNYGTPMMPFDAWFGTYKTEKDLIIDE